MTASAIGTDLLAYNFNLEITGRLRHADMSAVSMPVIGQSLLHQLAREGDVLSAEVILQAGGNADHPDDEGRRPLHEAAFFGRVEMIDFLLSNGALLDAPVHPFGHTALYYAVQQGQHAAAKRLIRAGACLSVADVLNGAGLLHLAAGRGDTEMAGILIAAGIDVFAEDKRGMTARDHAARYRHKGLEKTLITVMLHHARG